MSKKRALTPQEKNWGSKKGAKYAKTYFLTPEFLDWKWKKLTRKHSRTQMNKRCLGKIPRDISILEIGCNVGNQLAVLREMGFKNLSGIELHPDAVKLAKKRRPWAKVRQCSALDLVLKPNSYDMVMTTWVLTHIAPEHVKDAMKRAGIAARRWIWGCEPWWPHGIELHQTDAKTGEGYLWKGNYAALWRELFPAFKRVRSRRYDWIHPKRPGPELEMEMFLLEKTK